MREAHRPAGLSGHQRDRDDRLQHDDERPAERRAQQQARRDMTRRRQGDGGAEHERDEQRPAERADRTDGGPPSREPRVCIARSDDQSQLR